MNNNMYSQFDRYVGRIFDRRYKISKVIGVGGMAVVFEAVDLVMHRTVAVKMLRDDISNDPQAVKRIINESRAVSMLSHPNIVSICDVSVRDNIKYIVMERIEGITLRKYMNKKGVLSLRETISITEQILRALEHAHSKGIIHRDIKPQNIMMLRNGQVKVTDFGIARLPNAENVTVTDKAVGTVDYISPEQASAKAIDTRSDLYSLGVVMYEMTTGKKPFRADNPVSVAMKQVNEQPRPPRELNPDIPIGMEQIILTAMEKNPDNRFQSAGAMLRALDQLKSNPHVVFAQRTNAARRTSNGRPAHRPPARGGREKPRADRQSRSMFPIIMGVTTAFLLVAIIGGIMVLNSVVNGTVKEISVEIANYTGQNWNAELKKQLEDLNYYDIDVEYINDENSERNTIVRQEPSAGEFRKVQPGKQYTPLKLTVSLGVQKITLEDYTITDYRMVKTKLDGLGLKYDIMYEDSDTVSVGYVTRTEPAQGTVLSAGDTVVLYVSKGQTLQYVQVPNCVNKTAAAAAVLMEESGLKVGNVTYEHSASVAKGNVISQTRTPFSEIVKGSRVDFVVSLGSEEE